MTTSSYKAMMLRLRSTADRFAGDCRGLAALEFALIVPLMFTFFFGMIEVTNGFTADRKVAVVARTLSDLTSRARTVTATDVTNFFTIGGTIMQPYADTPDTPLAATISEIYIDPDTSVGRVQWSRKSSGVEGYKSGTVLPVPPGLIAKDANGKTLARQYLILSEVNYKYIPAVGYIMSKAGITLSDSTFTRPRQADCVYYPSLPQDAKCPTS